MSRHSCRIRGIAVFLFAGSLSGFALAAPSIEPGEWEYTMKMKMEMPGMPASMPEMSNTFTSCVTAKDPTVETPEMRDAGCKMLDRKVSGNSLRYTAICTQGDSVLEMRYRLTYDRTRMKGEVDQVHKVGGQVQAKGKGTMAGKRIGACKKK